MAKNAKELKRLRRLRWRNRHPEQWRAEKRRYMQRRYTTHPEYFAARHGLKGAKKRSPNCVPEDFDLKATAPFYAEARRRTLETGVRHEVDHIIALALGGLHIASNLQVITAKENRAKSRGERRHKPYLAAGAN